MAITFSEIAELVARFGNSVVTEQADLAAPFIGKGTIKKEKHSGTVGIVNVKAGGLSSTGFVGDGNAIPAGQNNSITQLSYHPKALFTRLSVPRIAALTAVSKQDGVNLVKEQMETAGADLGRTLGRAVFQVGLSQLDAGVGTSTITTGGGPPTTATAPATIADLSGYRLGMPISGLTDDNATPQALVLVVTSIDYDPTATPNVTFNVHDENADGTIGPIYTGSDDILNSGNPTIQNNNDANASLTSLLDLADEATGAVGTLGTVGNYESIASAPSDFVGNGVASGGALTVQDMDELSKKVKRRSGRGWTHSVMNSTNLHNYMSLLVSERRFVGGSQSADASVSSATYEGKPVIVDENMTDGTILLFTDTDCKLAEWRGFQPDYDGKKAAMVSDSSFIYDTQMFGLYNLRCTKRSGLGKLTGITGGSW